VKKKIFGVWVAIKKLKKSSLGVRVAMWTKKIKNVAMLSWVAIKTVWTNGTRKPKYENSLKRNQIQRNGLMETKKTIMLL
jgi:hypothetical protein